MRRLLGPLALFLASPALADPIGATKTVSIVTDPLGNLSPRGVPGAVIEYRIVLTNPASNATLPVRNMIYEDQLPSGVKLRVADLGVSGSGPVGFTDGEVVLGIGASGLTVTFAGLGSATDGLDFSDGSSWSYTPVADGDGYDARVRAIRIKPLTTFKTGGSFTLRYRAQIK